MHMCTYDYYCPYEKRGKKDTITLLHRGLAPPPPKKKDGGGLTSHGLTTVCFIVVTVYEYEYVIIWLSVEVFDAVGG